MNLTFGHGKLPVSHYTATVYTYLSHIIQLLCTHTSLTLYSYCVHIPVTTSAENIITNNTAVKATLPNVFIPSNVNKLIP
jgi:hypothetical protein